jgi:anti-sigma-K factor RskA
MEQAHHRRFEEDLAAYLLDALEPDELREFRLHLEGCASCQNEERWLRSAVEQLPSSVEQLEPPVELRNRLMARVQIEAQSDRASAREAPAPPRRRWWSFALRPAAALAVLAIAAAGVGGYLIGNDNGGTSTQTIQAKATPAEPDAQAALVRRGDTGVLKVAHLPEPRRGHVYQTWLQRGKMIEPSSLFVVGKDGSGSAAVGDLDGVGAVMVSEEPAGGSAAPTSKPVLIASL